MKISAWIGGALFALGLTACTSTPTKTETTPIPTAKTPTQEEGHIDYNAIQTYLKMDRSSEDLGYAEKVFNTCEVGYGYSRSQNCHKEYFVVLNFRLMCRDTEGTISTILTDADVAPIAGKDVRWALNKIGGNTTTDGLGYAQIRTVSSKSQFHQRLKIAVGNDFLYMRSDEIKKVITPRSWCYQ